MSGTTEASRRAPTSGGFARTASIGTRWTTAQGIVNKLASMVGMIIVAQALSPGEFGLASLVLVASGFVMIVPTSMMADVLVTHQRHEAMVTRSAVVVVIWTTIGVSAVMVASAPLIAWFYPAYDFGELAILLALSGTRPITDALMTRPLARLRIEFRYREVATIHGTTQLGATVLTVLWALAWPSAAAIVVPQILAAVAKTIWFVIAARDARPHVHGRVGRVERRHPALARRVRRQVGVEFLLAALSLYVHTVVCGLPLLVVSRFLTDAEMGQFSFAYQLAVQAAAVLVSQLSLVLQPIFGRLKSDPMRQVAGFLRVIALISAIMVPVALLQAALAQPLILFLFGRKWLPSEPILVACSVAQAFSFTLGPVMALLKAQGRFGTLFVWQVVQGTIGLGLFIAVMLAWGEEAVAWTDTALWAVTMPVVAWIACAGCGVRLLQVVRAFLVPWFTASLVALAAWGAWRALPGPPRLAAAVAVLGIGPVSLFISVLAIRLTQPAVAAEVAPFMRRVLVRVPVVGTRMAEWYASHRAA